MKVEVAEQLADDKGHSQYKGSEDPGEGPETEEVSKRKGVRR